jgi:hypothetical protein
MPWSNTKWILNVIEVYFTLQLNLYLNKNPQTCPQPMIRLYSVPDNAFESENDDLDEDEGGGFLIHLQVLI